MVFLCSFVVSAKLAKDNGNEPERRSKTPRNAGRRLASEVVIDGVAKLCCF